MKANPAGGGLPWRGPFFAHTPFDSFPVHQRVQDQQAAAHQVRPWMAVGFARPEPRQHRHQQIGLEERQRGGDFVGLAWHGGSSGRRRLGIHRAGPGAWLAGPLLERRYGAGVFRQGLFFWSVSKMASSSGR